MKRRQEGRYDFAFDPKLTDYSYRQEFNLNPNLNYQANTGYTSLSFEF
jgi:hypothetical protein